ncbi:hypothetical protein CJP46_32880 [Paenibacillus sp. XY044]|nr:hypothetical protein CJP46_32880 [Paenibacillus sp. XY044]
MNSLLFSVPGGKGGTIFYSGRIGKGIEGKVPGGKFRREESEAGETNRVSKIMVVRESEV